MLFPESEARRYLGHDRDSVFADVATTIAGMDTDGSNRAAIDVAQCLRGTRHRFDPTRVPSIMSSWATSPGCIEYSRVSHLASRRDITATQGAIVRRPVIRCTTNKTSATTKST